MRYAYFSFILIFIMMVAFCASCSENARYHYQLHEGKYASKSTQTQTQEILLKEQHHLKQEQKKLLTDIDKIVFDNAI